MSSEGPLERLRGEIDQIDADMHDLLMRRTEIVLKIRDVKGSRGGPSLRAGREAQILRQLLGRHRGPFPKPALVRVWREILATFVGLQGPFSVAVFEADGCGFGDLSRDHFGSQAPMTAFRSAGQVIDAVRRGEATVGVLPAPRPGEPDPWWPRLVGEDGTSPRVVARLPFAGHSNGRGGQAEALVIGRFDPESTGHDRSFLAVDAETEIRPAKFEAALAAAGLQAQLTAAWSHRDTSGIWAYLTEVDGFIQPNDTRVEGFIEQVGSLVRRVVQIGAYALPFAAKELATDHRQATASPRKAAPKRPERPARRAKRAARR